MSYFISFYKQHKSLNSNLYLYFFSTSSTKGLMSNDPLNIEIWDEYVYFTIYANYFCNNKTLTSFETKFVKSNSCCYYGSSSVDVSGVSLIVSFYCSKSKRLAHSSYYQLSYFVTFSFSFSFSSDDDYSVFGFLIICKILAAIFCLCSSIRFLLSSF